MFFPLVALALLMFLPLFVYREAGPLDFWWWMSGNLIVLISLAAITDRLFITEISQDVKKKTGSKLLFGLLSAVLLYFVFYAGNFLVRELFDFAGRDISKVYDFKGDAHKWRIGLLMLLVIGPGEELLWRAYIQGNFMRKYGRLSGYLLGVFIYTAIHVATGNLILIVAALTGGLFWGWMYMRYRSVTMNMVSHIIWDIGVFLIFPFQ